MKSKQKKIPDKPSILTNFINYKNNIFFFLVKIKSIFKKNFYLI